MPTPRPWIPRERRGLYYGGMVLAGFGLVLFLATVVTSIVTFGNVKNYEARARVEDICAFGGMALVIAGSLVVSIGAQSAETRAAPESESYEETGTCNGLSDGAVDEVVSEVMTVRKTEEWLDTADPQVKVRCRKCHCLNDHSAKFCNQCGTTLF